MWWLLIPVVILWALGTFIWVRGRRYRAAFHVDHFREVILALGPLGQAALERVGQDISGSDDPRMFVSSQGVVLTYAVARRNELFVHRVMLRHLGGPTTFPVARRFLALCLFVFDPDGECDRVQRTPEGLFFVEWLAGQERQAELNESGYALPPGQTTEQIRDLIGWTDARSAQLSQVQADPLPPANPADPVDPPNSRT